MVKKGLMVQLWRIQQSQGLISLFFWALTLAGIFYVNYVEWFFIKIGLVPGVNEQRALGTIYLFLMIVLVFLLIGLLYDRVLKLWVEQTTVAVERNPYSKERLMPKEVVFWQRGYLSIMKEIAKKDSSMQKDLDFMDKWMSKSLQEPGLRKEVEELEQWVKG